MKPPEKRQLEYILGWVVGHEHPCAVGTGCNIFYVEDIFQCNSHPTLFTQAAAEKRAREEQAKDDINYPQFNHRWFWRAWKYTTTDPKNGKGLQPWTGYQIFWVKETKSTRSSSRRL